MKDYTKKLKQHWFIVCRSNELKEKPYPCEVLSKRIVVFRGGTNVTALVDRCPHRNAPLSKGKIRGEKIECPYHGWQFDAKGECKHIPGRCKSKNHISRNAESVACKEHAGFIWVNLSGDKVNKIDKAPHLKYKDCHNFIWQTEIDGSLVNICENFLDGTHTHFVHKGLIRKEGNRQRIRAKVIKSNNAVEVQYLEEGKQSGVISKWFEQSRATSYGRFILPSVAQIEYCSHRGVQFAITAYITPISQSKQKIFAVISINRWGILPAVLKQWIISPFLKIALKQDQKILRLQDQNIRIFKEEKFTSTEIDVIRPHIESLLRGKEQVIEKEVSLML